jgi:hypothetical protein
VTVDVISDNPLWKPYRTGSYLIYDIDTDTKKERASEHFRSAWSLETHPYPASGSHQLDAKRLFEILKSEVVVPYETRELFLVDLREETHGFLDGRAVSWYSDNDFGNVGQPPALIERDEEARLAALAGQTVHVFRIEDDPDDNRRQQRVMPVSYEEIDVMKPETERQAFDGFELGDCTVHYIRIPVTDHTGPSDAALRELCTRVPVSGDPASVWVHFHCHGGDGRTTTFLALYDMVCWKQSADPLPDRGIEEFACRQCRLFSYCLNPYGCRSSDGTACGHCEGQPMDVDWKSALGAARWRKLKDFLESLG